MFLLSVAVSLWGVAQPRGGEGGTAGGRGSRKRVKEGREGSGTHGAALLAGGALGRHQAPAATSPWLPGALCFSPELGAAPFGPSPPAPRGPARLQGPWLKGVPRDHRALAAGAPHPLSTNGLILRSRAAPDGVGFTREALPAAAAAAGSCPPPQGLPPFPPRHPQHQDRLQVPMEASQTAPHRHGLPTPLPGPGGQGRTPRLGGHSWTLPPAPPREGTFCPRSSQPQEKEQETNNLQPLLGKKKTRQKESGGSYSIPFYCLYLCCKKIQYHITATEVSQYHTSSEPFRQELSLGLIFFVFFFFVFFNLLQGNPSCPLYRPKRNEHCSNHSDNLKQVK